LFDDDLTLTSRSEQLSCAFVTGHPFYKQLRMNGFFRLPIEENLENGEKSPKAVQFF
jgi:hypothetical protein